MSDIVNEVEIDLTNPEVVDKLLDNKDLRKLPIGSENFKAAARESLAKMDETTDESAVTETVEESTEPGDDYAEETIEENTENSTKPKKTRGMLKRIESLVAEREELKRKLQEVELQRSQPTQQAQADDSTYNVPKPQFKDFETIEEYTEALTDWKLEKREFEYSLARQQQEVEQIAQKIATSWEQKEQAVKQEFADYSSVVNIESLQTVSPSDEAKVYLSESSDGPRVLYTLLSDESLLEKFIDATPTQQVALLAKIETRFENSEDSTVSQKKATITRAPEPAKALPKGKAVPVTKDIYNPDLSFEEFNRLMDERERAKRKR